MSANHYHYIGYFNSAVNAKKVAEQLVHNSVGDVNHLIGLRSYTLEDYEVTEDALHLRVITGTSGDFDLDLLLKLKPFHIEFVKVKVYYDQVGEYETAYFYRAAPIEGDTLDTLLSRFEPQHRLMEFIEDKEFGKVHEILSNTENLAEFADENRLLERFAEAENLNLFKLVLDAGANPNIKVDDEPLIIDILQNYHSGCMCFAKALLESNIDVNTVCSKGGSILWYMGSDFAELAHEHKGQFAFKAANNSYQDEYIEEIMDVALHHHDFPVFEKNLEYYLEEGHPEQALFEAAVQNDNLKALQFLEKRFPTYLTDNNDSIIETASMSAGRECVTYLLDKQAPLEIEEFDFEQIIVNFASNHNASAIIVRLIELAKANGIELSLEEAAFAAVRSQCDENLAVILPSVNDRDEDDPLLHRVMHHLTPANLKLLLDAGYSLEDRDYQQDTFLDSAACNLAEQNPVRMEIIKRFSEKPLEERIWKIIKMDDLAAFISAFSELENKEITDEHGNSLLIKAIDSNAKEIFAYLLTTSPNLESKNKLGNTALALAVIKLRKSVVEQLLIAGCDANAKVCIEEVDEEDDDAESEILNKLFENTTLGAISHLGEIATQISEEMTVEGNDSSCLMFAAAAGHLAICKLLVENGADVNAEDEDKEVVLWYAVRNGHHDVYNYLREKGAEIRLDSVGDTLLHLATYHQHTDLIKPLVEAGIDINQRSKETGETALCTAAAFGALSDENIVELLISLGADVNIKTDGGSSALIYACQNFNPEAVPFLLAAGADVNVVNEEGKTAYDLCLELESLDDETVIEHLKPNNKLIGITKVAKKVLRFIWGSLIPAIVITVILGFIDRNWGRFFFYSAVVWWIFKALRAIKRVLFKPKPVKKGNNAGDRVSNALLGVMADVAEKEEKKKRKSKEWEDS